MKKSSLLTVSLAALVGLMGCNKAPAGPNWGKRTAARHFIEETVKYVVDEDAVSEIEDLEEVEFFANIFKWDDMNLPGFEHFGLYFTPKDEEETFDSDYIYTEMVATNIAEEGADPETFVSHLFGNEYAQPLFTGGSPMLYSEGQYFVFGLMIYNFADGVDPAEDEEALPYGITYYCIYSETQFIDEDTYVALCKDAIDSGEATEAEVRAEFQKLTGTYKTVEGELVACLEYTCTAYEDYQAEE